MTGSYFSEPLFLATFYFLVFKSYLSNVAQKPNLSVSNGLPKKVQLEADNYQFLTGLIYIVTTKITKETKDNRGNFQSYMRTIQIIPTRINESFIYILKADCSLSTSHY